MKKCMGGYKITKSQEKIMYMDDIKLFEKKRKRTGDSYADNKNIQPGYKNGIWQWKICQADNENWKKRNSGKNRTTKSGKHYKVLRRGKLQVLENIGSGYHQTSRDEGKNKKRVSQNNEKASQNQE